MTMFQNPADYWGLSPEQANRLPLGLRKSNNLFNIKYYGGAERNQSKWPGLLGPSEARDQGDPQMKFGSVDDSGVAGANLLRRKYDSGMTTPNQIIAGQNGWTPGYQGAANNVARLAGVESGGDLKLDSPDGMRRMLPALAEQEHGPDVAKRLFSDDMFDRIAERSTGAQFASGKLPGLSSKQFASDSELTPQEQDISSRRWDDAPTKPVQSEANVAGWNSNEQRATRQGARQPIDEEQQPGLLDNLAGRTIYNPGFQQGLGLFLAASQGKDLNEGLNSGVARGGSLFAQHQKMVEMRRQQAAQFAMKRMLNDPSQLQSIPQELRALTATTGDPTPVMNYIAKHPEMEMERQKLQLGVDNLRESVAGREQARKQHDRMYPLQEAEAKARIAASQQKDGEREFSNALYGRMLDGMRGGQGGAAGPTIGQQPRLIPQSFDGDGAPQQAQPAFSPTGEGPIPTGDPNLIRTQAATGQAQQPSGGGGVQLPGFKRPLTQEEATAFALSKDKGKFLQDHLMNEDKLGKAAGDDNEKHILKSLEALQQVRTIRSSFDPKFLEYGTQGKMAWNSMLSKIGTLPEADREQLYKFATFRSDTAAKNNQAIKDASGATVTVQEMSRNNVQMANAGSGIFDGDDPVSFKAKLDRNEEVLALGVARQLYLKNKGFTGNLDAMSARLPLDQMKKMINERAALEAEKISKERPGLPDKIISREATSRAMKEFGI